MIWSLVCPVVQWFFWWVPGILIHKSVWAGCLSDWWKSIFFSPAFELFTQQMATKCLISDRVKFYHLSGFNRWWIFTLAKWRHQEHVANMHGELCIKSLFQAHGPVVPQCIQTVACGVWSIPLLWVKHHLYHFCGWYDILIKITLVHSVNGNCSRNQSRECVGWSFGFETCVNENLFLVAERGDIAISSSGGYTTHV